MLCKNDTLSIMIKCDKLCPMKVVDDKLLLVSNRKAINTKISCSNFGYNQLKSFPRDDILNSNLSTHFVTNNSFKYKCGTPKSKQHILTRFAKYTAFATMTMISIWAGSDEPLPSPRQQSSGKALGPQASSSTLPVLAQALQVSPVLRGPIVRTPELEADGKSIFPVNLFIMFSIISICNVDSWINLFLIGIISLHRIEKQWQDQKNWLFYILDNIIGMLVPLMLDACNFGWYLPLVISLIITVVCYLVCKTYGKTNLDLKDLLTNIAMLAIILIYHQFLLKLSFIVKLKKYFASLDPNSNIFSIFSYILKFIISTTPYLLLYGLNTWIGKHKNRMAGLYALTIFSVLVSDLLFQTNFIILLIISFIFNAESFSVIEEFKRMIPTPNFF